MHIDVAEAPSHQVMIFNKTQDFLMSCLYCPR